MKVGVIARADQGGLASLTSEVARHLKPDRVLVVDMGLLVRGTGTNAAQYEPWCGELFTTEYRRPDHEAEHFLTGLDVVYTAETAYTDHTYQLARQHGVKIVVHVMPELFGPKERQADAWWNPTDWEHGRLPPAARVVPVPAPTDAVPYRYRTAIDTLFCSTGEAMQDRNGAQTVVDALGMIERPVRLLVRGGPEPSPTQFTVGKVDVEWLPPVERWQDVIPEEADALLMPRRYGGLCMPALEAAARGVLPIMSRLAPQTGWFDDDLLLPAHLVDEAVAMKGGRFPVFGVDPQALATKINWLIDTPQEVPRLSARVHDWAQARSWSALRPLWMEELDRVASS